MNHPNLSDEINRAISKSEIEGGIWLQLPHEWATVARAEAVEKGNVLPIGATIAVQTKNSLYRIERRGESDFWISGNPRICPEAVKANIHGSTFGGSMLKMGFVGRGMNLEFSLNGKTYTSTPIQEITEEKAKS